MSASTHYTSFQRWDFSLVIIAKGRSSTGITCKYLGTAGKDFYRPDAVLQCPINNV